MKLSGNSDWMQFYNWLTFWINLIQDGSHSHLILENTTVAIINLVLQSFTDTELKFDVVVAENAAKCYCWIFYI